MNEESSFSAESPGEQKKKPEPFLIRNSIVTVLFLFLSTFGVLLFVLFVLVALFTLFLFVKFGGIYAISELLGPAFWEIVDSRFLYPFLFILQYGIFFAVFLFFKKKRGLRFGIKKEDFRNFDRKILLSILLFSASYLIVTVLYSDWILSFLKPGSALIPKTDVVFALAQREGIFAFFIGFICTALLPAVFEELLFRGTIQTLLTQTYGLGKAVFVSSILFMLIHLSPIQFPLMFFISVTSGLLYGKTGKLIYSVTLHLVVNTLVFFSMRFSINTSFGDSSLYINVLALLLLIFSSSVLMNPPQNSMKGENHD